jgi:hypothetical protein
MNTCRWLAAAGLLLCSAVSAQDVSMARVVPYSDEAEVSSKVRSECTQLQQQLADYTREFGKAQGITVNLDSDVSATAAGRVLQLEIVEAVSMGNAFIGHQKYSRVHGTLFEDGQKVGSFKARRNSMGGAFAGYKGSCSVLGRTMKALGEDIAGWLKNPSDQARLGDL